MCAIIRNKFTLPVSKYFEQNKKRFLDDCFIFLRLSLIKPNKLQCLLQIKPPQALLEKHPIFFCL